MDHRYFAIVLAMARHSLYAAAALPMDHVQRKIVRHQVERLIQEFSKRDDMDRYDKLCRLAKWFDDGAVVSDDIAVLSES